MSGICNPCSETLGKRYDKLECKTLLRPYGADRMIGFHCSVNFDDILDTASDGEWADYLTSGKILLTPSAGKFELGDGSSTPLEDGCGRKIADITDTPWTFSTFSTAEDYSDEQWWRSYQLEFSNYTWGWLNCAGRLVLNDAVIQAILAELAEETPGAVPASFPGYPLSLESIPAFKAVNGFGKSGQWVASGTLQHGTVVTSIDIPGLSALLSTLG